MIKLITFNEKTNRYTVSIIVDTIAFLKDYDTLQQAKDGIVRLELEMRLYN